MDARELKKLTQKYLADKATLREKSLLNNWYEDTIDNGIAELVVTKNAETAEQVKNRILSRLQHKAFLQMPYNSYTAVKEAKNLGWKLPSFAVGFTVLFLTILTWPRNSTQPQKMEKQFLNTPKTKIIPQRSSRSPDSGFRDQFIIFPP